jgi:hypothetical protein
MKALSDQNHIWSTDRLRSPLWTLTMILPVFLFSAFSGLFRNGFVLPPN